jgi:DNA-binding beta-propeller fold protein YncE
MDETSLHALLDHAAAAEPPLGQLVANSLRDGKRLRRRRIQGQTVLVAAVALIAAGVPAAYGPLRAGRHVAAGVPAAYGSLRAGRHAHGQRPPVQQPTGDWPVAYNATPKGVVPFNTETGMAGPLIKFHSSGIEGVAVTPDGKTVYAAGQYTGVVPIDTSTDAKLPPIPLPGARNVVGEIAMAPDGKIAYAIDGLDPPAVSIIPINTAENTALTPITTTISSPWNLAFTPDSSTAYLVGSTRSGEAEVVPIQVATARTLSPIRIGAAGGEQDLTIAPDGKTVAVLNSGIGNGTASTVTLISTATGTARPPISIAAAGSSDIAITPDSTTAYVNSASAVFPIDIATDSALAPIRLPAATGMPEDIAIAPEGSTVYVFATRQVARINIGTRTLLPPIAVSGFAGLAGFVNSPAGPLMVISTDHGEVAVNLTTGSIGRYANIDVAPNDPGNTSASIAIKP